MLGQPRATFHVDGHHYALVVIDDLEPGAVTPYEVHLDGERVWPPDDGRPPCAIHTRNHERQARLVFGSCRVGAPQRPPYTLARRRASGGLRRRRAVGVLAAAAGRPRAVAGLPAAARRPGVRRRGLAGDRARSSAAAATCRSRPGEQVADFEEYTRLYRESWSDPDIRWLLVDGAEHDDLRRPRRPRRLEHLRGVGARHARASRGGRSASSAPSWRYWLYQHLGNLAPPELAEERLCAELQADEDAGPLLREFAHASDRESAASRFAFHRDFGRSRLVVVDSRAARVLADGRRDMVDDEEWDWIVEHARGGYDHLIIASTLPVFMLPAIHYLEAWNEAVCSGAWGGLAARAGEKRPTGGRPRALAGVPALLRDDGRAAARARGRAATASRRPRSRCSAATSTRPTSPRSHLGERQASRVYQVVCSPFRNPLAAA